MKFTGAPKDNYVSPFFTVCADDETNKKIIHFDRYFRHAGSENAIIYGCFSVVVNPWCDYDTTARLIGLFSQLA